MYCILRGFVSALQTRGSRLHTSGRGSGETGFVSGLSQGSIVPALGCLCQSTLIAAVRKYKINHLKGGSISKEEAFIWMHGCGRFSPWLLSPAVLGPGVMQNTMVGSIAWNKGVYLTAARKQGTWRKGLASCCTL